MDYSEIAAWVKTHNLIMNRVKCVNDVTLDLCTVRGRAGRYRVEMCGSVICSWKAYDLRSCDDALVSMNAVLDTCWHLWRLGYASFAG